MAKGFRSAGVAAPWAIWARRCVLVGIALLAATADASAQQSMCQSPPVPFASCPNAERNFRSVLLAVHGWGGKCRTTFGKGKKSLFSVIKDRKFFDFDCFDYDSFRPIDDIVADLRQRLHDLADMKYSSVYFVTHSLGGVIALRAYTDYFLDAQGALRGGSDDNLALPSDFRLTGLSAWAAPLNGLKSHFRAGGKLVEWLPFLRSIARKLFNDDRLRTGELHELKPNSKVLRRLKDRLHILNGLVGQNKVSAKRQHNLPMPIRLYTGQGDDWVVRPIIETDAIKEGWLRSGNKVIQLDKGHTEIVSEVKSDNFGLPLYPAEITDLSTLLYLRFMPRYDEVFPKETVALPPELEKRQMEVIEALFRVATESFDLIDTEAVNLLTHMVLDKRQRFKSVDERLWEGFNGVIASKPVGPDLVEFFCKILRDVFADYQPIQISDSEETVLQKVGKGAKDAEKQVLEVIRTLWDRILVYVDNDPKRTATLKSTCIGIDELNSKVVRVTGRFLDSKHDVLRNAALGMLSTNFPNVSEQSIQKSEIAVTFNNFILKTYDKLPDHSKKAAAAIYKNLVVRTPETVHSVYATLIKDVTVAGKKVPLVATLGDNDLSLKVTTNVSFRSYERAEEKFDFWKKIAVRGGTDGKDLWTAKAAVDQIQGVVTPTTDDATRTLAVNALNTIAKNSSFGVVQRRAASSLKSIP